MYEHSSYSKMKIDKTTTTKIKTTISILYVELMWNIHSTVT